MDCSEKCIGNMTDDKKIEMPDSIKSFDAISKKYSDSIIESLIQTQPLKDDGLIFKIRLTKADSDYEKILIENCNHKPEIKYHNGRWAGQEKWLIGCPICKVIFKSIPCIFL